MTVLGVSKVNVKSEHVKRVLSHICCLCQPSWSLANFCWNVTCEYFQIELTIQRHYSQFSFNIYQKPNLLYFIYENILLISIKSFKFKMLQNVLTQTIDGLFVLNIKLTFTLFFIHPHIITHRTNIIICSVVPFRLSFLLTVIYTKLKTIQFGSFDSLV